MFIIEVMSLAQGGKIRRKPWVIRSNYIRHIDRDYFLDENDRQYSLSREDMISSDWELYEEKPKTYTFQEAIYKLHNNEIGAIKRKNIPNGRYVFINDTGTLTISNTKDDPFLTYIPSINDILAKDWEIYEGEKE